MSATLGPDRCRTNRRAEPCVRGGLVWTLILLTVVVVIAMVYFRPQGRHLDRIEKTVVSNPIRVQAPVVPASRPEPALLPLSPPPLPDLQDRLLLRLGSNPASLPPGELIARLLDANLPAKEQREAGWALARLGSDEAIAALKAALRNSPSYLKAAIAEGLGESPHPEARAILLDLLKTGDEITARGAIRGFGLRGDAGAATILSEVLFDVHQPESLRTESALSLGDIRQPEALAALTRAATEVRDPVIAEGALDGLGRRPVAETDEFFRAYLGAPDQPLKLKVVALEALGNAEGDVTPLLLSYAAEPNPDLRAAAAWALNLADTPGDLGPQLLDWLKQETKPEVRARLYRALASQDVYDASAVLALSQRESNPAARLASLDLLAEACRFTKSPDVLSYFGQTALPELKNTALMNDNPESRLSAVMALQRAETPQADNALQDIARNSADPKVIEAAQAALRVPPRGP